MATKPRLQSDPFLILIQPKSKVLDMLFLFSSKHEPFIKKRVHGQPLFKVILFCLDVFIVSNVFLIGRQSFQKLYSNAYLKYNFAHPLNFCRHTRCVMQTEVVNLARVCDKLIVVVIISISVISIIIVSIISISIIIQIFFDLGKGSNEFTG